MSRPDCASRRSNTDEVATCTLNYVFRDLKRIHMRARRATMFEFNVMMAYLLPNWIVLDDMIL